MPLNCIKCGVERKLSIHSDASRSRFCRPCGFKEHYVGKPKKTEHEKLELKRAYYKKRRQELDAYAMQWKDKRRAEVISALGGKCISCSIEDPIVLNVDHVNNDGKLHRKMCTASFLKMVLEESKSGKFQLLCCNCNWRKEYLRRKNAIN